MGHKTRCALFVYLSSCFIGSSSLPSPAAAQMWESLVANVQWMPFGAVGHLLVNVENCTLSDGKGGKAQIVSCAPQKSTKYTCDVINFQRAGIKTGDRLENAPSKDQLGAALCSTGPLPKPMARADI